MRMSRSLPPIIIRSLEAVTGVAAMIREPRLRRTASTSASLMKSASYLGGMIGPPSYCAKIRFDPTPRILSRIRSRLVIEMVTTRITEALPINSPSAVRAVRILLDCSA